MTVEEYVARILPLPLDTTANPSLLEMFTPTIDAIKKLAFAPYFWFISDYTTLSIVAMDPGIENHVPFAASEWLANGPEVTLKIVHPDDLKMKIAYDSFQEAYLGSVSVERRKHLKFNIFFRIRDRQGSYRWYMTQMPDYRYDENGKIMFALRVAYDVSHIKTSGLAMMTLLDDEDPANQMFLSQSNASHKELISKLRKLTNREVEVIKLIAGGYLSKQIAARLGISPYTVENHKRNIFRKTDTRSAHELVAFAFTNGIV